MYIQTIQISKCIVHRGTVIQSNVSYSRWMRGSKYVQDLERERRGIVLCSRG